MNKWLIVALAVGGFCVVCSGATLMLGLLASDDGSSGPSALGSADCPNTLDGWTQTITSSALVLEKGGVVAELAWPFPITDAHRQGDSEKNLWSVVLGSRYEAQAFTHVGSYGERRLAGPATERSSGRTVFIAFTSGANNGIANPISVIVPEESMLGAFPTEQSLGTLASLNRFSLGCAGVAGRWKSGFSTAAERYAAGTGQFQGIEAVAAWRDLQLDSGGSYHRESMAMLHGVFNKNVDSGSWSNDGWSLTLEPESGEPKVFDAFYLAVQNGFLLHLTDRKFTGDHEEFQRVE